MTTISKLIKPFEMHSADYDAWFDKHHFVFKSEVEALREKLPLGESHGIEVGLGTGRFSVVLGLKEGVEPALAMAKIAAKRGIEVMDAVAENLPYKDIHFDFVLMASSINYFYDLKKALSEANRVLKKGGSLIIGFIDKDSPIGRYYQEKKSESVFYKHATFYPVSRIVSELMDAGFHNLEFSQTLFKNLDEIDSIEVAKDGYGEGSFVVVKAIKK